MQGCRGRNNHFGFANLDTYRKFLVSAGKSEDSGTDFFAADNGLITFFLYAYDTAFRRLHLVFWGSEEQDCSSGRKIHLCSKTTGNALALPADDRWLYYYFERSGFSISVGYCNRAGACLFHRYFSCGRRDRCYSGIAGTRLYNFIITSLIVNHLGEIIYIIDIAGNARFIQFYIG